MATSTAEKIRELTKKRGSMKRQLTTFESLLDAITIETDIESLDLETRFKEKLLPILNLFEQNQEKLESLISEDENEEKKNEDERASFENRYYSICGRVKSLIKRGASVSHIPPPCRNSHSGSQPGVTMPVSNINSNNLNENGESSVINNPLYIEENINDHNQENIQNSTRRFPRVKYPDIKIPTFSGSFDTWLSFFDTFSSMIHNDPELPTIQKFHYLKGCLTGDAANIIASLETTTQNYKVAWDLLRNRYHNKKFIIDSHVKALFEIPCMSKDLSIRALYDRIQKHVRALNALSVDVDKWDAIIIHLIKSKLNSYTIEKWEESTCSLESPTLQNILEFLERRSQIEETRAAINQTQSQRGSFSKSNFHSRQGSRAQYPFTGATTATSSSSESFHSKSTFKKMSCFICKGEHGVFSCSQFLNLSPKDRYEAAKRVSLCPNCLRGTHHVKNCISGGCRKCGRRHNSLLHIDNSSSDINPQRSTPKQVDSQIQSSQADKTSSSTISNFHLLTPSQVVLATAVVDAIDNQGNSYSCRIMLDGGSQPHIITERFASKLGLTKIPINVPLGAIDNLATKIKYTTKTKIKSRYNNLQCDLSLFIVQTIGNTMPTIPINRDSFSIPQDIFLADPTFQTPAEVDMILGAEYFYHFMRSGKIPIEGHPAVLQETEFGWVVAGAFNHERTNHGKIYCNYSHFSDLSLLWELNSPKAASLRSQEEEACELHYITTTRRDDSGRYIVQLPFNEKIADMGESRHAALIRFQSLENKFKKDPAFKKQYVECIRNYINAGHMTPLPVEKDSSQGFFLPHHAVIKSSSLTTKTRVVFDGSCKSSTGISLNDAMRVGPTIQDDLFSTFTRFRTFIYALTADIEQMYRQVQLFDEHRLFHKIFWRETSEQPLKIYTLNTVTFGTASAPFLAIRTLHQLAEDERKNHPVAAAIVERDFYVDDLLTGANTFQEARSLRDDLIKLLKKGGFNLRKWGSNDPDLINDFETDARNTHIHMSLDPTETVKTLGLFWNPCSDLITYTVNITDSDHDLTKRSIFSQIAKLFDPLGLIGPVIVSAKLIIQDLWKTKLDWDDVVPSHLLQVWSKYKTQLPLLNHVQFKRCICIQNPIKIQLHTFCDASEKAYGTCMYLRSTDKLGNHNISLICSKSRVAPLKQLSLPKLELCAAFLGTSLYQNTTQSLKIHINETYFWSDSTIVLQWINTPSRSLETFMANRVAEIQSLTNPQDWRHVPSLDNPADLISRGQTAKEFLGTKIWQNGPQWLSQPEDQWPQVKVHTGEIPGLRKNSTVVSLKLTIQDSNFLERYSSFQKTKQVLAYCLRAIHNMQKGNKITGPLSPVELENSELKIIQLTQSSAFSKEIHNLSSNKALDSKSSLLSLNPFLDKGILKVGGRLEHAQIPETQKHPIILPKNHHITKLIIQEEHVKKMHAGTQSTLYGVRERYWPIDGRNVTRHIIRQCLPCFRAKPRVVEYLMGNLPEHRVSCNRPFLNVGVDYCGPFYIKEKRLRNRNKVKAYVSVFVCFSTKAVHLEVVSDLTTESFIGCLKRFFSRRGKSQTIYSDNATNFLGARNELKRLYDSIESLQKDPKVQTYLSKEQVNWRFITPRAPHMGGLWEASVKSFKHHLTRTVGSTLLTYEQLETYVIQIEAILNSRPISPLSSDPNDLLPLTPGHFLTGGALTSSPQEDLRSTPVGRLSAWQHAEQMQQHFWSRWQKEYLHQMISRTKWQSTTQDDRIKIGTLVVLKEDNLPPMNWKLGRIIELHPGQDKIVRVVTVKTNSGLYTRNVTRLYPLPIIE